MPDDNDSRDAKHEIDFKNINAPKDPSAIKEHEMGALNLGWTPLDELKKELVRGVTYIWAVAEDQKIYLGIEKAINFPQAFAEGTQQTLDKIKDELETKSHEATRLSSLGHVTIA